MIGAVVVEAMLVVVAVLVVWAGVCVFVVCGGETGGRDGGGACGL